MANVDPSSINNHGQFVSIDSRPISCARGTLKQTISLYKSYLRSVKSPSDGQNVVDPFLYLNIICPQGSYDVNVEPAKDDVVFTDNDLFLSVIESFLVKIYGELKVKETEHLMKLARPRSQRVEILLARKPQPRVKATQNRVIEGSDTPKHHEDTSCTVNSANYRADSLSGMLNPEVYPSNMSFRLSLGYSEESNLIVGVFGTRNFPTGRSWLR